MATHAITWHTSHVYGRHNAATSTTLSLLVQFVELLLLVWRAMWASQLQPAARHAVRPGRADSGVDEEFAADLHDWNDPDSTDVIPAFLADHDQPPLCGYLTGNPYDQMGGAA